MKILVSACLLGKNCCYHGGNNHNDFLSLKQSQFTFIPVCPEELGNLSTPRAPAEVSKHIVITIDGKDVTKDFQKGALETLKISQFHQCKYAVLKSRSPSCGYQGIYDGSFSGNLVMANGITAELLAQNKLYIYTEETMHLLFEQFD